MTFRKPAATKPVAPSTPASKASLVAPVKSGGLAITKEMGAALALIGGIDEVEAAPQAQYFPIDFEGVVSVRKFVFAKPPGKPNYWIVEFRVETSNTADVLEGDTYSYVQNMDQYDYGKQALVQFCQSAAGLKPTDKDRAEELAAEKASRQETILGYLAPDRDWDAEPVYVYLKTRNKPKQDGSPFTLHTFFPVPAEMMAG